MRRTRWTATAVMTAAAIALMTPRTDATTHYVKFAGTGTGAIPDGIGPCPSNPGPTRLVFFNVAGLTGTVTSVRVTFSATHSWVGDLDVRLYAPNLATTRVFGKTGLYGGSANACGDSSNLGGGPYTFTDTVKDPTGGGWWQLAASLDGNGLIPGGVFNASALGTAAGPPIPPMVSLDAAFAGVAPNGLWSLEFVDEGFQDTGSVTAATLEIATTTTGGARWVDYDGDNITDFNVVRPIGGTTIDWYTLNSQGFSALTWGSPATDFIISGDFDGDGKSDPAIWRPGSPGVFWVKKSSGGIMTQPWGLAGDDPAVVGDYDGDGKTDFAVYRCPPFTDPEGPCYFYVLRSSNGTLLAQQWGFGNDGDYFPLTGDFDGDGKADFAVQTGQPGNLSQGIFYFMQSTEGYKAVPWGLSSDFLVPGDYDGDGKSDIMIRRTVGGTQRQYWGQASSTGATIFAQWGIAGDVSTPGDYDGDGKTDFAIWRPSTTPGQSAFYVRRSNDLSLQVLQWGQNMDVPAAGFQVH